MLDASHADPPGQRRPDLAMRPARKQDEPGVGDLHLATVVVNVLDMERAVAFWGSSLGYEPRETRFDPEFMMLHDPQGRGLPVSCS